MYPAFSPDGRRIAFVSLRSGTEEIWLCDSDGSRATQLTSLGGSSSIYGPNWSPDRQNIAFTAVQKGAKEDIYSISANGGSPRRLTTNPAEDKLPYWSHDGRWIYFSSTRSWPGGNMEDAVQRWRGGSDHAEFRRRAERITRRQISVLHEGMAGGRDRLENSRWMEAKKPRFSILCIAKAGGLSGRRGFSSSDLPTKWDTVTSVSTNSTTGQTLKDSDHSTSRE